MSDMTTGTHPPHPPHSPHSPAAAATAAAHTLSDATIARGVLAEASSSQITLAVHGSNYQLHLQVYQLPGTEVGKRIAGTIRAQARRIDVVRTGGRYVEPLYGRPRRVQGEIIAMNPSENSVTVDAGVPIVCKITDPRQRADQFKRGDFVSFDVLPGATFTVLGR